MPLGAQPLTNIAADGWGHRSVGHAGNRNMRNQISQRIARKLRNEPTVCEQRLWQFLRLRQLMRFVLLTDITQLRCVARAMLWCVENDFFRVIPAKAGIQCRSKKDAGSPPSRGRRFHASVIFTKLSRWISIPLASSDQGLYRRLCMHRGFGYR